MSRRRASHPWLKIVESPKPDLQFVWVKGIPIPIPYRASASTTDADGSITPVYPTHVNLLEKAARTGDWSRALQSMRTAVVLELIRACTFQHRAKMAPLATSNALKPDEVAFDGYRIIINEEWGSTRALDADGDMGAIIRGHKDVFPDRARRNWARTNGHKASRTDWSEYFALLKWPLTKKIGILKAVDVPKETWGPIDPSLMEAAPHPFDPDLLGLKYHHSPEIGLLTNAHNLNDIAEGEGNLLSVLKVLLSNPERYQDIEEGGLKRSRANKDNGMELSGVLELARLISIPDWARWGTTGASATTRTSNMWVVGSDLEQVVRSTLSFSFPLLRNDWVPQPVEKVLNQTISTLHEDDGLLERLTSLGLVELQEIPHQHPNLPPCLLLALTLPNGTPVGLTDVKRGDGGITSGNEGLSYGLLVPPIWVSSDLETPSGEVLWKGGQFISPIDHLSGWLMQHVNSPVLNPETGELAYMFPRNLYDWRRLPARVGMVQRAITRWAERYGKTVPANIDDDTKSVTPTAEALYVMQNSIIVEHEFEDIQERLELLKEIDKKVPIAWWAPKIKSPDLTRYYLRKENQVVWAHPSSHPARPARLASQLLQARKCPPMTVAVVSGVTKAGTLITRSGRHKQHLANPFLNQVFSTHEEWLRFCEGHGVDSREGKKIICPTWTGDYRMIWVWNPRPQTILGKLICPNGMKFMPRPYWQARYGEMVKQGAEAPTSIAQILISAKMKQIEELKRKEDVDWEIQHQIDELEREIEELDPHTTRFRAQGLVDLIIPIEEFHEKGCWGAYKDRLKPSMMKVHGDIVPCLIGEISFLRSGSASENIPSGSHTIRTGGMEKFSIAEVLHGIGVQVDWTVDLSAALAMQKTCVELHDLYGLNEDEPDDASLEQLVQEFQL